MHTDVLIIGSGPAGYSAGLYSARAGFETTIMMGHMAGGQLMLTHEVENYPGFTKISGIDLMASFQKQAEGVGVHLKYDAIKSVNLKKSPFLIETESGQKWTSDALIIATGSSAKWLGIEGEEKFKGHGVSTCTTCDGFFFKNKNVAVIGGGSSAAYKALHLAQLAKSVTLIHRRGELTAEHHLVAQLQRNPKISIRWDTRVNAFLGDEHLKGMRLENVKTGAQVIMPIDGAFEAIGSIPNSSFFDGQLEIEENGYIITDKKTQETSVPGVFACGDVQEKSYRQAVIAAGSGCVAALSAEKYLIGK